MRVFRIAVAVFAVILIVVGAMTAISPIPFGLPLVVLGFVLLATSSPATLRWMRRRWGWLDRRFRWLQERAPARMRERLRRTDPYPDQEDDEETEDDGSPAAEDAAAVARRLLKRA